MFLKEHVFIITDIFKGTGNACNSTIEYFACQKHVKCVSLLRFACYECWSLAPIGGYQSIVCSAQMFCVLDSLSLSFRVFRPWKQAFDWLLFFHFQLYRTIGYNNLVFFKERGMNFKSCWKHTQVCIK